MPDSEQGPSLWDELLAQHATVSSVLKQECNVIILGSKDAGGRSLIAHMKGKDVDKDEKGYAMECDTIHLVKVIGEEEEEEEEREEIVGQFNVWHVHSTDFADLIKVAVGEQIDNTIILLLADLSNPLSIFDNLKSWEECISKANEAIFEGEFEKKRQLDDRVHKYLGELQWQLREQQKQKETDDASTKKRRRSRSMFGRSEAKSAPNEGEEEEIDKDAQIPPGLLDINLGFPLVVVGTKADKIDKMINDSAQMERMPVKEACLTYPKQFFNYLQGHLRKWCMARGATLIYTSTYSTSHQGTELLKEYIRHRMLSPNYDDLISFMEDHPISQAVDACYAPFGLDSKQEIQLLTVRGVYPNNTPFEQGDEFTPTVLETGSRDVKGKSGPSTSNASGMFKKLIAKNFLTNTNTMAARALTNNAQIKIEDKDVEALDHCSFLKRQLEIMKVRGNAPEPSRNSEFQRPSSKASDPKTLAFKEKVNRDMSQAAGEKDEVAEAGAFFTQMLDKYNKPAAPASPKGALSK